MLHTSNKGCSVCLSVKAQQLKTAHDEQFLATGSMEMLPDSLSGNKGKVGTRLHLAAKGGKGATASEVFFAFWRTYFKRLAYEHVWTGIFSRDIATQVWAKIRDSLCFR